MNSLDISSQEYLAIDRSLLILEKSLMVSKFADRPIEVGEDVRCGFPELIGLEAILQEIFSKQKLSFKLKDICRYCESNKSIYFNLNFILEMKDRLIILFEDVTAKNFKYQQKMQAANECKLIADRISENNNFQEIVKSQKTVLLITDRFGIINNISPAALNLFKYSRNESIDRHISILFDRNKLIFFNLVIHQNLEVICQTKTKENIYMNFSCLPIDSQQEEDSDLIFVGQKIIWRIK
ncbi:MAG: PAS domain-containing protein [Prochloraceae cyanobacterium]|nr:PAS domain-containing protein [Prochloraceae cyanobacterium]